MAVHNGDALGFPDLESIVIDQGKLDENPAKNADSDTATVSEEAERIVQDAPRVQYKDQFVAFIDLLGFRQIVMRTSRHRGRADESNFKPETLEAVHSALSSIRGDDYKDLFTSRYLTGYANTKELQLGVAGFSDTLIFWCDEGAESFGLLIHAIFRTIREFTVRGFYCRGGIKFGEVLIDDEGYKAGSRATPVMFGPAFIQAYDLEQKQANEARVILCNETTFRLKQYLEQVQPGLNRFFTEYLYQSTDGPWQIDIFADLRNPHPEEQGALSSIAKGIAEKLNRVMSEYTESPAVYRKLLAVAKAFNGALANGKAIAPDLMEYQIQLPQPRH